MEFDRDEVASKKWVARGEVLKMLKNKLLVSFGYALAGNRWVRILKK